jgi:PAS domain S-box-containing protein
VENATVDAEPELSLAASGAVVELFDRLPDVVFFAKDTDGRYVQVNGTLVRRLGATRREDVLGRTAVDLFPPPLGRRYLEQDLAVIRSGRPLEDMLELHLYPDHGEGWCITAKLPVRSAAGEVVGLVGTSRDVHPAAAAAGSLADLAEAVRRIHEAYPEPLKVDELAALARLSEYQFGRRIKALFGITPAQLVIKTRIDAARRMLAAGKEPVAGIAIACGYCDQSAFTRQFKAVVGLTPVQYRRRSTS